MLIWVSLLKKAKKGKYKRANNNMIAYLQSYFKQNRRTRGRGDIFDIIETIVEMQ